VPRRVPEAGKPRKGGDLCSFEIHAGLNKEIQETTYTSGKAYVILYKNKKNGYVTGRPFSRATATNASARCLACFVVIP